MRDHGIEPDAALVSDSFRTQQTWQQVAAGAGWDEGIVVLSDGLYAAGTDSAFDLVRDTATDVRTLVVIGHNPTMAYLASVLDDGTRVSSRASGRPSMTWCSCVRAIRSAGSVCSPTRWARR